MSSAGHVLDMIKRFNNNRNLQQERHSQYAKVKKAYQKVELKHLPFRNDINISKSDLEKIKKNIRKDIRQEFKKKIILTAVLTPIAFLIAGIIVWQILSN